MTEMKLTREELFDLADLCDREADAFDYDEEVYDKFNALRDKLVAIIKQGESK